MVPGSLANTLFQQHKRRLYTLISPDGQHRNQIDYILCSQRWRTSIQSAKTRPGADCGSDHEPLIAKFRLKLKKVGKTSRPLRYDLNQIPNDYTVKVRNRFKGLDLIDTVPDELWMEIHDIVQETGIKTIPENIFPFICVVFSLFLPCAVAFSVFWLSAATQGCPHTLQLAQVLQPWGKSCCHTLLVGMVG